MKIVVIATRRRPRCEVLWALFKRERVERIELELELEPQPPASERVRDLIEYLQATEKKR